MSDDSGKSDKQADLIAAAVIFTMLVLGALHFVSGWQPDLG